MHPTVAVIGDAVLDVHVTPAVAVRRGADVPAAVRLEPGGQGANLAVRLARRGLSVRLACALGNDTAGEMLRAALAGEGVDVVAATADRTGVVVVLLDPAGDRTMLSQRVPVLPGLETTAFAAGAAWVVISGYVLLEGPVQVPSRDLSARRALAGSALQPAEAGEWLVRARVVAPKLVVLNLDEARTLTASDDGPLAQSRTLGAELGSVVVVTHAGGAAVDAGEPIELRAQADGRPVDTTGAGDAFAATLLAELLDVTWPPGPDALRGALRAAVSVAAAVTRVVGAQGRIDAEADARLSP